MSVAIDALRIRIGMAAIVASAWLARKSGRLFHVGWALLPESSKERDELAACDAFEPHPGAPNECAICSCSREAHGLSPIDVDPDGRSETHARTEVEAQDPLTSEAAELFHRESTRAGVDQYADEPEPAVVARRVRRV